VKKTTLEEFLGILYADPKAQERFRANPTREAILGGLSVEDCESLSRMDWSGFELACRSFNGKRNVKARVSKRISLKGALIRLTRAFRKAF
jgi:hypothetical protein